MSLNMVTSTGDANWGRMSRSVFYERVPPFPPSHFCLVTPRSRPGGSSKGRFHTSRAEMPDISVGAQIFDLIFHPTESIVYAGLLTGEVKAFGYDEQGQHDQRFSLKPSKRSCRGLAIDKQGDRIWSVGKGKSLW